MRWVALCYAVMFPSLGFAQDLDSIKAEAAACRQYIAEIGLDWPIPPWDCRDEPAQSLSQALQYDLEFSGGREPLGQNTPACDPLIEAGFPTCDYNVRITLAQFLSMYGVDLFPSGTRTFGGAEPGDTAYYGTGEQNAVLMGAIKRNAALFADGDLTAAEVALWR